jgi:hypothetical protein
MYRAGSASTGRSILPDRFVCNSPRQPADDTPTLGALSVDEEKLRGHVDEVVRASVEETLNGLPDAGADRTCQLTGMAGIWTSADGMDVNPKPPPVPSNRPFIERYEFQPIDAQTNGPQFFYGGRTRFAHQWRRFQSPSRAGVPYGSLHDQGRHPHG